MDYKEGAIDRSIIALAFAFNLVTVGILYCMLKI